MTICKQVLKINENLYIVKKILKEEVCKNVDLLKEFYLADIVFKKEELLYFCESITDLEYENI